MRNEVVGFAAALAVAVTGTYPAWAVAPATSAVAARPAAATYQAADPSVDRAVTVGRARGAGRGAVGRAVSKPDGARTVVGTVRVLAADTAQHAPDHEHRWEGRSRDHYRLVLVTADDAFFLKGKKARPNTKVRVTGRLQGKTLDAQSLTEIGDAPSEMPASGTTRVLVILAHWNAPDSVTPAYAAAQMFSDSNGYFRDASYTQLGQDGDVTPWVRVAGPAGGQCYADHMNVMDQAQTAARGLGYDPARYDNVVLYFPNNRWQSGSDCDGFAGWAYVGSSGTWLNGYMDRRVTVHEQGHNYGLRHSHSHLCSNGMSGTCDWSDYGDPFDAMGNANYVGHFSASQKYLLGWLNARAVDLSSGGNATLVPVSSDAPAATAARVTVAGGRTYWLEYRQPTDFDAALPVEATDGVLVHVTDPRLFSDNGSNLIDVRPEDGAATTTATLRSGSSWTSPEGVTMTVGEVTGAGATVSVTAGPPPPCPDAALEPDSAGSAPVVPVPMTQHRAFCTTGDRDWLRFSGVAGRSYRLETLNLSADSDARVDTVLHLYGPDGTTLLASNDDTNSLGSRIDFTPDTSATYVLRAEQFNGGGGERFTYDLRVTAGDDVAPQLAARTPAPGETDVSRSGTITATFSEEVVNVDGSSFTVKKTATGTTVGASVSRTAGTTEWVLDPAVDLAADTRYTVTLTGAVRDLAGNPMAFASWTFTTGPAPYVKTRTPAPDSTDVSRTANLTATFSEAVLGVATSTFTVQNTAIGTAVSATVTRNGTTNQWVFNPSVELAADTRYTATLTGAPSAIRDAGGNPMATKTWTFLTGPAPYVKTRTPAPGATAVSRSANITTTFNEAVVAVGTSTFTLRNAATGAAVSAVVTRNSTTDQWLLNPTVNLAARTRYTATLTGGVGAIRDPAGNPMATKTWSFTTAS